MKKFILSILAVVLLLPCFAFVGCGKESHAIDMTQYFKEKVNYQIFDKSAINDNLALSTCLDNKFNTVDDNGNKSLRQYTSITFNGNTEWLYKMTIEKIAFSIYSNVDMTVQFEVKITNVHTGNQEENGRKNTYIEPIEIQLKKDKAVKVEIRDINDYFESYTATTTINISTTNDYFRTRNENNEVVLTDLNYDISNFQVYGVHKRVW